MRKNRSDDSFGQELIQVHVQPGLLLGSESHGFGSNWRGIVQAESVMILRVLHLPNIRLFSGKAKFTGYQALQESAPRILTDSTPELTLG